MDQVEIKALQDLATLFINQELGPLLTDLIGDLPAAYAPIANLIESAILPAAQAALLAEVAKI